MRILAALILPSLLAACAPAEPYLQWDGRLPAPGAQGRVAVKLVVDKRPPKHGTASDPNNIGNWRGGFGNPFAIRVGDPPNPPLDQTLVRIVGEAVSASGVGFTTPQDPYATAHLAIEIGDFWCDGYMGYKATVNLMLVVLDPPTGGVRMRIPIMREASANASANPWGHVSQLCKMAYRDAITAAYNDILIAFLQPGVRAAALGAPPPQPPAPPPLPPQNP
jgi:hypothetical protein